MRERNFCRRRDLQTSRHIDRSMTVLRKLGLPQAYAYLVMNGIPGRIVKRILSMPGDRRKIYTIYL